MEEEIRLLLAFVLRVERSYTLHVPESRKKAAPFVTST